jgi:hypothetical protein
LPLPVVVRQIPISDMPVYIIVIRQEIGANWMNIGLKKATDRRNIPTFELEDVSGRYTCYIRVLLKVREIV